MRRNGAGRAAAAWTAVWVLAGAASADGATAPAVDAQEEAQDEVRLELRVTVVLTERRASVDRGASDGLAVGDVVWLLPREGGRFRASVVAVEERSAVVELDGADVALAAGLKAEATVPASRFESEDGASEPTGATDAPTPAANASNDATGARPSPNSIWRDRDEEFADGMPLLAGVEAVSPGDRTPFVRGRVWLSVDGTYTGQDGRSDQFVRAGTDVTYENPFGQGGVLDLGVDWERLRFDRPELDDLADTELRFERLSYAFGGTRFDGDRYQFGRFLQHGMPEFGVLDGAEWSRRTDEHHSFGASVGYMPEPDAEYESGHDFQLAGWYRWTSDATELAAAKVGFQKTWHDGAPDRDLVVLQGHYLPRDGWSTQASVWIDATGGGEIEGSGPSVSHAYLSASPYTASRFGLELNYSYLDFPELERDEYLPTPAPIEIADQRVHRLGADWWVPMGDGSRFTGRLGGWSDATNDGGDVEVGVDVVDIVGRGSHLRPLLFLARGAGTSVWGTRLGLSFGGEKVRYDLFYELANYRQNGFPGGNDDFVQHRLRTSVSWYPTPHWALTAHVDGTTYHEERGATAGVYAQWSF
ncbi:MAG: hypothetical protein R3F34_03570 [Planctomycetota bacterium]